METSSLYVPLLGNTGLEDTLPLSPCRLPSTTLELRFLSCDLAFSLIVPVLLFNSELSLIYSTDETVNKSENGIMFTGRECSL